MTLQELADKMGVSRQALSRQVGGKLLVEKADEIACMLDVPTWQLFASPDEVADGNSNFTALIKDGSRLYKADSWQELKDVVRKIEENK